MEATSPAAAGVLPAPVLAPNPVPAPVPDPVPAAVPAPVLAPVLPPVTAAAAAPPPPPPPVTAAKPGFAFGKSFAQMHASFNPTTNSAVAPLLPAPAMAMPLIIADDKSAKFEKSAGDSTATATVAPTVASSMSTAATAVAAVAAATATVPESSFSPASSEWRKVMDSASGKPYWYHVTTKATTWKDPAFFPPSSASAPSAPISAPAPPTPRPSTWLDPAYRTRSFELRDLLANELPLPTVLHSLVNKYLWCGLEDWHVFALLGTGSFGTVFACRRKHAANAAEAAKVYAMKVLAKRVVYSRNQIEHTWTERRVLELLRAHAPESIAARNCFLPLEVAFETRDHLCLVTDIAEGGEIFPHLKNRRRFGEDVSRLWIAELICAVEFCHNYGITHRTITPENVLIDRNGHMKLAGFGLSAWAPKRAKPVSPPPPTAADTADGTAPPAVETPPVQWTRSNTFCGIPEYLAPEVIEGGGYDRMVDWWTIGALLYEFTIGLPPFYDAQVAEMYNKIRYGVLRFPPFITDTCKSLITDLLNRVPTQRLGAKRDAADVKAHPFFRDLDWKAVAEYRVPSLYVPKFEGTTVIESVDFSNFDPQFTSQSEVAIAKLYEPIATAAEVVTTDTGPVTLANGQFPGYAFDATDGASAFALFAERWEFPLPASAVPARSMPAPMTIFPDRVLATGAILFGAPVPSTVPAIVPAATAATGTTTPTPAPAAATTS